MTDILYYKKKLSEEAEKLEQELNRLGVRAGRTSEEWDAKAPEIDIMEADKNEVADRNEEMHIDQIVLDELEIRYKQVRHALTRIENDTFGTCEVGSEPIEEERLHANPAARTCKVHMAKESTLSL